MTEKNEKLASPYTLDNFSSTATLTNNADLKGSVATIPEKAYNPFDHRQVEHPNSDVGSLIHLLKSSLGSGILAMPLAFRNGGLVVGAIGTFLVGFICTHCVHILVKCSHELCGRAQIPSMGFAETAGAAFKYGPPKFKPMSKFAKLFVDVTIALTYYGSNCVYVVLLGDSIFELAHYYCPESTLVSKDFMWMLIVPFVFMCQIRELKYLVPFAMLASVLLGVSLALSMFYMFRDIGDVDLSERNLYTSIEKIPLFFSTVIFAMDGIGVIFPLENAMKHPEHFLGCPGVLNIAMGIVITLYASVGFCGYLAFGEDAHASITLDLPVTEKLAQAVKICLIIAIMLTFALQFFVPMEVTWRKVFENRVPKKYVNITQVLVRIVTVVLSAVIAVEVGNLEYFIGFIGAISFSILGLMVPAIMDTITYWEHGIGKFQLMKNIGVFIIGFVALITGSYTNLIGIINNRE